MAKMKGNDTICNTPSINHPKNIQKMLCCASKFYCLLCWYNQLVRTLLDRTVYREEMRFALRSSFIIKSEIKQLRFLEIFILYNSENSIHTERQKGYNAAPPSHWHSGGGSWLWLFDWLYSSCTHLPISLFEESIWCCFCTCPKWKKEILSLKSARP